MSNRLSDHSLTLQTDNQGLQRKNLLSKAIASCGWHRRTYCTLELVRPVSVSA